MNRRSFIKISFGSTLAFSLTPERQLWALNPEEELFKISLAQWSLNKSLRAGKMSNLDFPAIAKKDFGIDCVEFVDQFFADKAKDMAYLKELKSRAASEGVTMGLLMLDTNGALGAATKQERDQSVEKTLPWIDAARFLGCRTVRVNARGPGDADTLRERIAESCDRLAEYAKDINIVIENHGGLSSDPVWLTSVMKTVHRPNFGTLPDFGNFPVQTDRYDAVEMMMPYAKAVSAKSSSFTEDGLVKETDYFRMMRIVRDGGYHGYVGVESGASRAEGEGQAIRTTRDLLLRIRAEQARCRPFFNGRDLDGWQIRGGTWRVKDGVIHGTNGGGWSHDPEHAGTWLSSNKQYADFRLEFQYRINEGGNSGLFFRSSHEKNPAFHGYELQIVAAPGTAPSKHGPTSIYDLVAPSENRVRAADQWNTVTLVARGPSIRIEMNGIQVMDTQLDKFMHGYIGLQVHDEKSAVQFKNLRLEAL